MKTASHPTDGLPTGADARKRIPLYRGVLNFFPLALAAVSCRSQLGQDQHNPDSDDFAWIRDKSSDHLDCVLRHIVGGEWDAMAWRALAHLQLQMEAGWRPSNWPEESTHQSRLTEAGIEEFMRRVVEDHEKLGTGPLTPEEEIELEMPEPVRRMRDWLEGITGETVTVAKVEGGLDEMLRRINEPDPQLDYFQDPENNRALWERQGGSVWDVDPEDDGTLADAHPALYAHALERVRPLESVRCDERDCFLVAVERVIPFRCVTDRMIVRVPYSICLDGDDGFCTACPGRIARRSVASHTVALCLESFDSIADEFRAFLNDQAPDGLAPFHGKVRVTPYERVSITIPNDSRVYDIQAYARWATAGGCTTQLTEDAKAIKVSMPIAEFALVRDKRHTEEGGTE